MGPARHRRAFDRLGAQGRPAGRPHRLHGGGLRPRHGHLLPFVHPHGQARRAAHERGRDALRHELPRRAESGAELQRHGAGKGGARRRVPLSRLRARAARHPRASGLARAAQDARRFWPEGLRLDTERGDAEGAGRRAGGHHGRRLRLRLSRDALCAAHYRRHCIRRRRREHHGLRCPMTIGLSKYLKVHRRTRKLVVWAGALAGLYAVLGFLVAPPIVRQQLEQVLAAQLGRKATIEQVRINPFALSASVRNFSLKERDGSTDALGFEQLGVNVTLPSLFRLGVVIESVQLPKPYMRLVRYEDGKYNFQDIIDRFASAPAESSAAASPPQATAASPRFAIYNVVLRDGRIDFDDQPQKTRHAITDLQIGLPLVSSLPRQVEIVVAPRLSANVNGTRFEILGEAKPFKETHEAKVHIDIDDLELGKYLAYSPVPLRIRVPSARLDTRLVLSYAAARAGGLQTLALSGTANLRRVNVQHADGTPLAALERLGIDLDSWDFLQMRAALNKVTVEAPEVDITREEDGRFKLLGVLQPPAPAQAAPRASEPALKFSVAEFALTDGKVRFVDRSAGKPVSLALAKAVITVTDLGNDGRTAKLKAAFGVGAKGRFGYEGSLQLVPLRTEGRLELAGLRLDAFAPYIEQRLNVLVTGGALSTHGRLSLGVPDGAPVQIAYRADAGVSGFASKDQATSQDL